MNRNFSLIISVVVVLVLLGVWLYLLFSPDTDDGSVGPIEGSGEFAEFGDFGEDAPGNEFGSQNNAGNGQLGQDGEQEEIDPDILRQLTTRNVIGYVETVLNGQTYIVFMESGVGHIYRINMSTNVEERATVTTIPDAREAVFTSDATKVAIKIGNSTGINDLIIGTINFEEKTVETTPLAEQVSDFTISSDDKLLYTQVGNSSSVVQTYDFETTDSTVVFSTPFRESKIVFGATAEGPHYYYPKTSHLLEGFIYKVTGKKHTRLPITKFGLSAAYVGNNLVITYREGEGVSSVLYDEETDLFTDIVTQVVPEKCLFIEQLYCAQENSKGLKYNSVDRWMQGVESFSDSLNSIGTQSIDEFVNIENFSGRKVDVVEGVIGRYSKDWYFKNKIDNTLWIYELSRSSDVE